VISRELLELLKMEETFRFTPAVTGDESWLYLTDLQTHLRSVSDDERLVRVENTITNERHMLIVHWSRKGLLMIKWLGRGDIFNTTYFCNVIIAKFVQTLYPGGSLPGGGNFPCLWTMLHFRFLRDKWTYPWRKINPITPPLKFAGWSTIQLLSFWNASRKAPKLNRENVWWAQTGSGFNSEKHSPGGTELSFSDVI
jgi:hypothetical protein